MILPNVNSILIISYLVGIFLWYTFLLLMLYLISGPIVMVVVLLVILPFNYMFLMLMEIFVVLFLISNIVSGSTQERSGSVVYLMFFGYSLGMMLMFQNTLMLMGLLLMLLSLANLPAYSLHIWLPNVHAEASLVGSIVLASAVLNLSILFVWNYSCLMFLLVILVVFSGVLMINSTDGKVIVAYSSVSHMTLCMFSIIVVSMYVGYIHIVLSPLMFIVVYLSYISSGSRYYKSLSVITFVLIVINVSFPYIGAFNAELYLLSYVSIFQIVMMLIYLLMGFVLINLIDFSSSSIYYMPILLLYLVIL